LDEESSHALRRDLRLERLRVAGAANRSSNILGREEMRDDDPPLYPGVRQSGNLAYAVNSGAILAEAPGDWADGCPVIEETLTQDGYVVKRSYLDPVSGVRLLVDVVPADVDRSFG